MSKIRRPLVVIEAPSNLGLMPPAPGHEPGTRGAPDTLRSLGLHAALAPRQVVRVEPAAYDPDDRRPAGAIRNLAAIADHARHLADAVEAAVRADAFALVLGGDCSLLLGSLIGIGRTADPSLLFLDGHTDFFLPSQSGTGGAAGMDLALATGWGPPDLTDIEGRRPYVDAGRVAALGNRDHTPRPAAGLPDIAAAVRHYRPLAAMRAEAVGQSVGVAVDAIDGRTRPYWVHMDVDVIDSALMPAVDSPQPDGLDWAEAEAALRAALAGNSVGLQVTIYDPDRDPGLAAGRRLAGLLRAVLAEVTAPA